MTPSLLTLLQVAQRVPWHDRLAVVLIVAACATAVVVSAIYPWTWGVPWLGLLALLAGIAGTLARAAAGPRLYPELSDALPVLRYGETLWVLRVLLIAGALLVIAGFVLLLWRDARDPETALTWRQVLKRLVVLGVVSGLVWLGLELAHRIGA